MNVGSSEENMNARAGRILQGFPCTLNIGAAGASQSCNDRPANHFGDSLDRFEIAIGCDRKPGFNHIDAEAVELVRQTQFLLVVHAATRRLFAIAEGCVENGDADLLGHVPSFLRKELIDLWYRA